MTYQIHISLRESQPNIWRRFVIPSNLSLRDLHKVIQITMGWTDSHLHQFIKDGAYYTERFPDDDYWGELNNIDYDGISVSALLTAEKEKIVYLYDFGDGWEHDLVLEKITPEVCTQPLCLDGKNSCPPEDCGGVWGYEDMLEVLKQPEHEEYESYIEWLGGTFDPTHFDKDEVNKLLRSPDFGQIEIIE
ncbi:MAG: plasmid pRiA4b ORF-3 family protein [Cryomorphaceae bacterium]|nr:plasmid pRiA4b ORF-3 family protein [Cryomorphaceae bacterium]